MISLQWLICIFMQGHTPRSPRVRVRITVRVRSEQGWFDAIVGNVSDGGLLLQSQVNLTRNQVIEIARGQSRIVGRVVWAQGANRGILARQKIDVGAFIGNRGSAELFANERRSSERVVNRTDLRIFAFPREVGRAFEFASFCAMAVTGSLVLAAIALSPIEAVSAKLSNALANNYRSIVPGDK